MQFLISAKTHVGAVKATNQDSFSTMVLETPQGPMAFSVLCDGMGGLEHGEVASATVVRAFRRWAVTELPELCKAPLEDGMIRRQWESIIQEQNARIRQYAQQEETNMGTTAVVMLLTQERYYILNIGDSRAYEVTKFVSQLTNDHSVVAGEVAAGRITWEEAEHHARRNVLTKCVGVSIEVYGDMFFGQTKRNAVYMLCSDGFRHELTQNEILENFLPDVLCNETVMQEKAESLIQLNMQRGEDDNISVVLIRTY